MDQYILALHSVLGLGPIRLKMILDFYPDPQKAWEGKRQDLLKLGIPKNVISELEATRKVLDPDKYLQKIKDSGIKFLTIYDEGYPKRLKEIFDPPLVFYYLGEIPRLERSIAIVGTRKVTGYGSLVTRKFAESLSASMVIVSGLAEGVDTIAHLAACEVGGKTVAVLGGGLNRIYPPSNLSLARKIASQYGAIISEFPPDAPSLPGNFPSRNRIIAGLSEAVLVTEAALDSGSLITARLGVEFGREVFAVPGPITSSQSQGTHYLIKNGAILVTDPQEILDQLGIKPLADMSILEDAIKNLSATDLQIFNLLKNESLHIDEIVRILGISSSQASAGLVKMEIKGLVKNIGAGCFISLSINFQK
ncbi:MAG: DNA-processing protein DprA [Candidatus Daviesbacteria bacterium]|nr:DNA-processing protein DprA [Candidatus Daviesbacteria bacterium]